MSPLKLFLVRVFGLDPELLSAMDRTDRISAAVNGDAKWMLTCRPKFDQPTIECDDGNTYKKVSK